MFTGRPRRPRPLGQRIRKPVSARAQVRVVPKTQVEKSRRCPLRRAPQIPTAAFVYHRPIWASIGKRLANLTALASCRASTRRRHPTSALVYHNRPIWKTIGKGVTDGTTVASRSPRTRAIRPKTTRMPSPEGEIRSKYNRKPDPRHQQR